MRAFGTITPSSNVVVERVTIAMTRGLANVSPHFARFGHAGTADPAVNDYNWPAMLGAARLLADARPDVICWNGSRGGVVGFDRDRLLCERIEASFGVKATTSTLALQELLDGAGIRRIAFATPYTDDENARIAEVWGKEGFETVASRGAGLTDNFSYSTVGPDAVTALARDVASHSPDVIIFYCTNFDGAGLCAGLEQELGIPMLDSVSAGVWKSLALLGETTGLGNAWGRLLR